MSIIETFFTDSFEVYRTTTTSDTQIDSYVLIGSFMGCLRPDRNVLQLYVNGAQGLSYNISCKNTEDVLNNDILKKDGVNYGVISIQTFIDPLSEDTYKIVNVAQK